VPAEHVTTIDHEMELPNGPANPARVFSGQRFVHHKAETATWRPFRVPGFQSRDTTIAEHTGNVAGVHVIRRGEGEPVWTRHDSDILFTFVMEGHMVLEGEGRDRYDLAPGDAFVIPPGMRVRYSDPSRDLELLEVSLPGAFRTEAD
jgi:mannose-6-phosphate isomerase-like protein (cupin superfamily)